MSERPTFSIVIETDNVAFVSLDELYGCLDSLVDQGPVLQEADGVYLADAGVVPPAVLDAITARYPFISLFPATTGTGYIALKQQGAATVGSEVIVFCDGDVAYAPGWLDALITALAVHPEADVVAGETTTPITGPYSLAFALTFNFPRFSTDEAVTATSAYWANNVAMRRRTLERYPIPDPASVFRGQCRLHSRDIVRGGGRIMRQPRARGLHAVIPPSESLARYVHLGRDASAIRRLGQGPDGRAYLPVMPPDHAGATPAAKVLHRVAQIAQARWTDLLWLPLALPIVAVLGAAYLFGRVTAPTEPSS
jgi:hypothetical protein